MKKTPYILHFVPGFRSGGIESLLMSLYECIDKKILQFDLIVDTLDDLPEFERIRSNGGHVFQLGRYLDNPYTYQKKVHEILNKHGEQYLALHSHSVIRALPILLAAKRYNIKKRILHSHTDSLQGSKQALIAPMISTITKPFATDFWACSNEAGKFFFKGESFKIFNNTIQSEKFLFREEDRKKIRDQLGIKMTSFVVGHTGRFTYQKNHEKIIHVFAELFLKIPQSHLLLVGEGPLEDESKHLAQELGIFEYVHFVGYKKNISSYLSAMDVFLLPSHFEGFCISLLEAQANGLPSLASNIIPEEVKITSSVHTCSLTMPTKKWVDKLLDLQNVRYDSQININLIKQTGFDTKMQLEQLIDMYYR